MKKIIYALTIATALCSCSGVKDTPFTGNVVDAIEEVNFIHNKNVKCDTYVDGEYKMTVYSDANGKTLTYKPNEDKELQALMPKGVDIGCYSIIDHKEGVLYSWGNVDGPYEYEKDGQQYCNINCGKRYTTDYYTLDCLDPAALIPYYLDGVKDYYFTKVKGENVFKWETGNNIPSSFVVTIKYNVVSEIVYTHDDVEYKNVYSQVGKVEPITMDDYENYEPKRFVVKIDPRTGKKTLVDQSTTDD